MKAIERTKRKEKPKAQLRDSVSHNGQQLAFKRMPFLKNKYHDTLNFDHGASKAHCYAELS